MINEAKVRALVGREIARSLEATRKIDPRFVGAVAALLVERQQFELADDGTIAAGDGRALDVVVGEWVAGSEANPFLAVAAQPGSGRALVVSPAGQKRSTMKAAEKGRFIREFGLPVYEKLPA